VEIYQPWHKRRLEAIPGITGIWQVNGRNRVSFDEMVRMDIDYIEHQSIWMDMNEVTASGTDCQGGKAEIDENFDIMLLYSQSIFLEYFPLGVDEKRRSPGDFISF